MLAIDAERTEEARARSRVIRESLAIEQLRSLPIERIKDATQERLRLGPLRKAGYETVADLATASPRRLEQLPGVGRLTAIQAVAAARQIAAAVTEHQQVRIDPERRDKPSTALLAALQVYTETSRLIDAVKAPSEALAREFSPMVSTATPTRNRLRLFFTKGDAKRAAIAALGVLAQRVADPAVVELSESLEELLPRVEKVRPQADADALWRDFVANASDYFASLADLGELDFDVSAADGYLTAEIVAKVNQQQLDRYLLDVSLRGYQAFGAKFGLVQRYVIIGDEMGLGKTIEALAMMAHLSSLGAERFMVVCPASVLVNWEQEIGRRSKLRSLRLHGGGILPALRRWVDRGGVAVTTYDTLKSFDPPEGLSIDLLVADEAHYVKNPGTQRAKALKQWIALSERVAFLTGTPMENQVGEFRTLVSYLQPELVSQIKAADGMAGPVGFRRAVAPAYLRRNQSDVLSELPDRLEAQDWVQLSNGDATAYREAVASGNFMAMRRAAFAPGSIDHSSKLARLADIAMESEASGWKVVVFSFFLDVLQAVSSILDGAVLPVISGSVPPQKRQEIVDRFNAIDGHAVLVGQIQAAGTGINLQTASVVVLAEPQWKPTMEEQAIGRCHRMGQTRRVHVHRLLAKNSVDERMLEILSRKGALFDEYVRESALKDAAPDAIDISDLESVDGIVSQAAAERLIVEAERQRLGIAPEF